METVNILQKFKPFQVTGLKRMGKEYDGGYIVHFPSLKDADYLISYGIGYDVKFEKDFYEATGAPTLAFDPTLKELKIIFAKLFKGQIVPFLSHVKHFITWNIQELSLEKYKISYIQEGISDTDIKDYKSFNYHFERYQLAGKKFVLKMDVEGAEYPIFKEGSIYGKLNNAVQIYMEFHDLENRLKEVAEIITRLEKTHSLIHIHANNYAGMFDYHGKQVPRIIEVSFLHNSYLPVREYTSKTYPVAELDNPCDRRFKDAELNFFS